MQGCCNVGKSAFCSEFTHVPGFLATANFWFCLLFCRGIMGLGELYSAHTQRNLLLILLKSSEALLSVLEMGLHAYLIQNGDKDFDMDKKIRVCIWILPLFPWTNKATGTITYGAGESNYNLIICSWLPAILKAGWGEVAEEWRKFSVDNTFCLLSGMPGTKGVPNQPFVWEAKCRFAVTLLASLTLIQQEKISSQLSQS